MERLMCTGKQYDKLLGYTTEDGWTTERHVISASTLLGNYIVPTGCSIVYVEDKVRLEGVVKGKVTIAAADVDTPGVDPRVILNSSITYANATSGFLLLQKRICSSVLLF